MAVADGGLDIDLVTIGRGELEGELAVPRPIADRVVDLGYLSGTERNNAFAAATAYVQPSRNESFSRTIMEAWLAGTPVIALAESKVVAWHCERSGGGLSYSDGPGLAGSLGVVVARPEEAARLAASGRRYVLDNYTWPVVLDRMVASLRSLA